MAKQVAFMLYYVKFYTYSKLQVDCKAVTIEILIKVLFRPHET